MALPKCPELWRRNKPSQRICARTRGAIRQIIFQGHAPCEQDRLRLIAVRCHRMSNLVSHPETPEDSMTIELGMTGIAYTMIHLVGFGNNQSLFGVSSCRPLLC